MLIQGSIFKEPVSRISSKHGEKRNSIERAFYSRRKGVCGDVSAQWKKVNAMSSALILTGCGGSS